MVNLAYVDTSVIVARMFGESTAADVERRLRGERFELFAHPLLEAECRAVAVREGRAAREVDAFLEGITWVHPPRPLTEELALVLRGARRTNVPKLRGADAYHLACAIFTADDLKVPLSHFLTLDRKLERAARGYFTVVPTFETDAQRAESVARVLGRVRGETKR